MEEIKQDNSLAKPPKTTKKQMIVVGVFAVSVLLVIIALIVVISLNVNKTKPSSVKIFDSNGQVYCQAEANDNFLGYRFKFDDGKNALTYDSKDSLVAIDDIQSLVIGVNYKVSVCYLAEMEGGNSEYSKSIDWLAYSYLKSPVIVQAEDKIDWDDVEGADYYNVYYTFNKLEVIRCTASEIAFDKLPAGNVEISVVAMSNYNYYKPSLNPAQLNLIIYKELKSFSTINYNSSNNVLTIRGMERVELIEISLDGQSYFVKDFSVQGSGGAYTYTINLSAVIGHATSIGARPASDNAYISYKGEFIFVN